MTFALIAAGEYGLYINGWKLLPIVLLAILWLKLVTWADKDSSDVHIPRETIGMINVGIFCLAAILYFVIPNIWGSIGALVGLFLADVGTYLGWRNKTVGLKDLGAELKAAMSFSKKEKEIKATEGDIVLFDKAGKAVPPPIDEAPERPAFDNVQSLIAGPVKVGANKIELRAVEGGSMQRYTVDGVTFEGKSFQKEAVGPMIEMMKTLAGMDIEDRRKPQKGKFKIGTTKGKHEIDISTAGNTAGESARLQVDFKKQFEQRLDTLGLLQDQFDAISNVVNEKGGVVLLTAPEGNGLTNLAYATLRKHDAYLSHIQTLEREAPIDLESVKQNKLPAGAPPAEETKQMEWIGAQEPDVVYVDKVESPSTAATIANMAKDGKRIYVGMRVSNTFDAVSAWRKLVGDDELALSCLKMAVAARLVRVLCTACKIPYAPDPEALRKMNMSPERVTQLNQARTEPMRDQKGNVVICPFCHGMGFMGRTGVYELFVINDEVRSALQSGANPQQLKTLFRKQKQRYLQESALARVELGDTSIDEVIRVMKSSPSSSSSSRSSSAK